MYRRKRPPIFCALVTFYTLNERTLLKHVEKPNFERETLEQNNDAVATCLDDAFADIERFRLADGPADDYSAVL